MNYLKLTTRAVFMIFIVMWTCLSTGSKDLPWREMRDKKPVTFDWNCTTTWSFPWRALGKVVRKHIPRDERDGPMAQGNRSFTIRLVEGEPLVYFVPLSCGAVGNCSWGVFTASPSRFLGELGGEYIYTYKASDGWPMIVTYTHGSVSEGVLETYVFRNERYRWLGDEYHVDYSTPDGKRMPRLFHRAKELCPNYGR